MKKTLSFIISIMFMISSAVFAQTTDENLDYVRNQLNEKNRCRALTITKNCGICAIYEGNGYSVSGVPESFSDALVDLNQKGKLINDVNIAEDGSWIILGEEVRYSSDLDSELASNIKSMIKNKEKIFNIAFNSLGNWIIMSNRRTVTSDEQVSMLLNTAIQSAGNITYIQFTDERAIFIGENNVFYAGILPNQLYDIVKNLSTRPSKIKVFNEDFFFICDDSTEEFNAYF